MKISKVNHTKSAIGTRKAEHTAKGFIYDHPYQSENKNLTLEARIHDLNKNAKNLYQILNPQITYTDDEAVIKICKKIQNSLHSFIGYLVKINSSNPEARAESQIKAMQSLESDSVLEKRKRYRQNIYENITFDSLYVNFKPAGSDPAIKETIIHDLVENCLRKSLRKTVCGSSGSGKIAIKEVIKKLTAAITAPRNFQKFIQKISKEELAAFLKILNEDYEKENRIRKIVKSIECQNVKVQPVSDGSKQVLHLSSADKQEEQQKNYKKYIFRFLTEYTAKNPDGQNQMIIHIRHLILLYCTVSGTENAEPDLEKNKKRLDYVRSAKRFERLSAELPEYFCKEAHDALEKRNAIKKEDQKESPDMEQRRLKKQLTNEIKESLRQQIRSNYSLCRKLILTEGFFEDAEYAPEKDICWLNYISSVTEKLLVKKGKWKYLAVKPLCEIIFKEWTSYISQKYIDMGKAVYHFAMPELSEVAGRQNVHIGTVREPFAGGLTSFDYERIKADETLDRDQIVAITFAAQNFSRCVCSHEQRMKNGSEDILQYKEKDFIGILGEKDKNPDVKQDVTRQMLRFWGGMSKWEKQIQDITGENYCNTASFVQAVKNHISFIRNSCYHYTSSVTENTACEPLLKKMFIVEYGNIGQLIFDKYYSNNVFDFYSYDEVRKLADRMYQRHADRPAQIPAFNRIAGQKNIDTFILECIGPETWGKVLTDSSVRNIYRASFIFLLKEIYYHNFLSQSWIKKAFFDTIRNIKNTSKDKKEKNAAANLWNRLDTLDKKLSFGEVCQTIMTDYHMQNQENRKVKVKNGPDKESIFDQDIYQHFRMLLYAGIRQVFSEYLTDPKNEKVFGFLKHPKLYKKIKKEDAFQKFTYNSGTWNPGLFSDIYQDVVSESAPGKEHPWTSRELLAWYTTAHFMNPKQLNLLIGSFKNYIQFMNDIHDRETAAMVKEIRHHDTQKTEKYARIIRILEYTQLFTGHTTNCLEDYFKDSDDYAQHAANYVHLEQPSKYCLQEFCRKNINADEPDNSFGIYFDAANPIVNRNIVFASMYGMEQILKECIEPIEQQEISALYALKKSLQNVFKSGTCRDKKEQQKLREFTNQKNRIELVNIMTYSEMLNDLFGQLVSWAYLRERDLMYFQLGYYYIKLFCGERNSEDDWMRTLTGNGIDIRDGAILYQIAAMYTYALPVYKIKKGKASSALDRGSSGNSVNAFYKDYCHSDASIYNAGLFFFEIVDEHDFIIDFRNEIDHFKYFSRAERSILEYYALIYDRFFDYDLKLKKSMSYILKNILARYFVVADLTMHDEVGTVIHQNTGTGKEPDYVYRRCACLKIKQNGLLSDLMVYKVNGKEVKIEARNEQFLREVRRILEYKKEIQSV